MSFEYWYMFPVAIMVSTLALSSGVSGATFFTPIFLLGLGLPLRVAIAAGLITATFGFASGLFGYARRRLIDYRLGARLMVAAIPAALFGVWSAARLDPTVLRVALGTVLLAIGASFWQPDGQPPDPTSPGPQQLGARLRWRQGAMFAAAGGFFLGMISAGLGELNAYFLIRRCRLPPPRAVATSVLIVAGTVWAAAGAHLVGLLSMDPAIRTSVMNLVMFTIPGVLIGAQIGCAIGSRAPRTLLLRVLGVIFALVAIVVVVPVLL